MLLQHPSVSLSDFALSLECLILLWLTSRLGADSLRSWFICLFAATAAASLAGAITHGFFPGPQDAPFSVLWKITLTSVGMIGFACLNLAVDLLTSNGGRRRLVLIGSAIVFALYALYIFSGDRKFVAAVVAYLPPTLLLLIACLKLFGKLPAKRVWLGVSSILLNLLAVALQQLKVSIDANLLNYNTLYHLIEAGALALMYLFGKALLAADRESK